MTRSTLNLVLCVSPNGGSRALLPALRACCPLGSDGRDASAQGGRATTSRPALGVIPAWSVNVVQAPVDPAAAAELMAAAAAADAAIIMVDVGASGKTSLMHWCSSVIATVGVTQVAYVITSMDDAPGDPETAFRAVDAECRRVGDRLGMRSTCIPLSGMADESVLTDTSRTPWYGGPSLMDWLESTEAATATVRAPFRMIADLLGTAAGPSSVSGHVVSGAVRSGDRVRVMPAGAEAVVSQVLDKAGCVITSGAAGEPLTITLSEALRVAPGSVLSAATAPLGVADQFEATLVWTSEVEMLPGRAYALAHLGQVVSARLGRPKHRVDPHTLEHLATKTLRQGDIGVCSVSVSRPIVFDASDDNPATSLIVLSDAATGTVVGAGALRFALRRAHNITWQAMQVTKTERVVLNGHLPCIVWFTGLSGAGKSTIANILEQRLNALGRHTYLLDGDNLRHGLNKDLGFTPADRVENIRRTGEVAKLMVDAGLIVIVSLISPFEAERQFVRGLVEEHEFCEVFVDTPLEVAERRDSKGLYGKARRGELKNFTGIDSPYEAPANPEVHVHTAIDDPARAAERIIAHLQARGRFDAP